MVIECPHHVSEVFQEDPEVSDPPEVSDSPEVLDDPGDPGDLVQMDEKSNLPTVENNPAARPSWLD